YQVIDKAAANNEYISVIKVSQDVLLALESCSWDALGVAINAFINCFIRVWKVTTLADLEAAICKNEGDQQFEELHQEVLNYLVEFMDANKGAEIKADELLDFIAKERSVDSKEKLHVCIQSLGASLKKKLVLIMHNLAENFAVADTLVAYFIYPASKAFGSCHNKEIYTKF
ncbi:hypothetical protein Tco_1348767, partial [Tanacetum coccineum]